MIKFKVNRRKLSDEEFIDFDTSLDVSNITEVNFDTSRSEVTAKVSKIEKINGYSITIFLAYQDLKIAITQDKIILHSLAELRTVGLINIVYADGNRTTFYDSSDPNTIIATNNVVIKNNNPGLKPHVDVHEFDDEDPRNANPNYKYDWSGLKD
jgi:hypothetical protein